MTEALRTVSGIGVCRCSVVPAFFICPNAERLLRIYQKRKEQQYETKKKMETRWPSQTSHGNQGRKPQAAEDRSTEPDRWKGGIEL